MVSRDVGSDHDDYSAANAPNNGLVSIVASDPPDVEYLDGPPRPNDVCVRHAHERVVC